MKHLFCYFALPIGYLIYCCAMLGEQSHISTVLIWFFFELIVELCIVLILILTSSTIDKKLEIYTKLEIELEIYKNLEIKLEIYSYFKLENKL